MHRGTASTNLFGNNNPRRASSARAKHAPCQVESLSITDKHAKTAPTTSSPKSRGSRELILPNAFADVQRTIVSASRKPTRHISTISSTAMCTSHLSSSSAAVVSCFVGGFCIAPLKLSCKHRAPRSYRHDTTRGFIKTKPTRLASLILSCLTMVERFAKLSRVAQYCASSQFPSAYGSNCSRDPILYIAASARSTPGTKKIISLSFSSLTSPRSVALDQVMNSRNASLMSGRVRSLASVCAATSRTADGSPKKCLHSRIKSLTTLGIFERDECGSIALSIDTKSNGANAKIDNQLVSTRCVSHVLSPRTRASRSRRTAGSKYFAAFG